MTEEDIETVGWDWRDRANYRDLLHLDRAGWAWKWLRRNPDYIAQASQARKQFSAPGVLTSSDDDDY